MTVVAPEERLIFLELLQVNRTLHPLQMGLRAMKSHMKHLHLRVFLGWLDKALHREKRSKQVSLFHGPRTV